MDKEQQKQLAAAEQEITDNPQLGNVGSLLALIRKLEARVEALENHVTK